MQVTIKEQLKNTVNCKQLEVGQFAVCVGFQGQKFEHTDNALRPKPAKNCIVIKTSALSYETKDACVVIYSESADCPVGTTLTNCLYDLQLIQPEEFIFQKV